MLTTKEFIEKIEALGFATEMQTEHESITVYKRSFPYFSMVFLHVDIYGTGVEFIGGKIDSKNAEIFNLLSQYFETPDELRVPEKYYYIYWSDVCGGEFFLDNGMIEEPDDFSFETRTTFDGVSCLENYMPKESLKRYQLSESEIKSLPTKWRPSYFGGLGFTQYEKVKDDKVAR